MLNESQKRTKRAPLTDALISKQPTKVGKKNIHNIKNNVVIVFQFWQVKMHPAPSRAFFLLAGFRGDKWLIKMGITGFNLLLMTQKMGG